MIAEVANRKSVIFSARAHALISIFLVAATSSFPILFSGSAGIEPVIVLYTAVACGLASVISMILARNVIKYPGVEDTAYIISSFCASYGVVTVALIFTRIPYSRSILLYSFFISVIFFSIIHSTLRRRSRLMIGVVPVGEYARLVGTPGVDWRIIDRADADVAGFDAISADLWADLPDEWERQLAFYALQGMPVYHSKHLRESLTGRVEIEHLSESTFGTLSPLYTYMTAPASIIRLAVI